MTLFGPVGSISDALRRARGGCRNSNLRSGPEIPMEINRGKTFPF